MEIHTMVLIGSGNVATHLGRALADAGVRILQVYSRKEEHARVLATRLGADAVTDPSQLHPSADLYLLSLSDAAYEPFLRSIPLHDRLFIHTSGSMPMGILREFSTRCGVLYPLQTFTREREVNLREVPLLVEGNDRRTEEALAQLAARLSDTVQKIDSEKRRKIHLAAVFASNFVNHLLVLTEEQLSVEGIDIRLLAPLVRETCVKAMTLTPGDAQTGPAMRQDWNVIRKHMEMLEGKPELREIYELLSRSIASRYTLTNPDTHDE